MHINLSDKALPVTQRKVLMNISVSHCWLYILQREVVASPCHAAVSEMANTAPDRL